MTDDFRIIFQELVWNTRKTVKDLEGASNPDLITLRENLKAALREFDKAEREASDALKVQTHEGAK